MGEVNCVREFDVAHDVDRVSVNATFPPDCAIDINFSPSPPQTDTVVSVRTWNRPGGGISDDCLSPQMLVRVDANDLPWLEDVATGQRTEIVSPSGSSANVPDFAGWSVHRFGQDVELVSADGQQRMPEFTIVRPQCVFHNGDVAWVGGDDTAWDPWVRSLGEDPAWQADQLLEFGRGHPGGPPPAAATLVTEPTDALSAETIASVDAEIGGSGSSWWSTTAPNVFIGNRLALADALGGVGGASDVEGWQWLYFDSKAVRVNRYQTPAGNTIWQIGDTIEVWDDCSKVSLSPTGIDGLGTLESSIDAAGGIVDVVLAGAGTFDLQVVADYRDERCRQHSVLGPIIDQLVAAQQPPLSPLPTAPARPSPSLVPDPSTPPVTVTAQTCSGVMLPTLNDGQEDSLVTSLDRDHGWLTITVIGDYQQSQILTVPYGESTCVMDPVVGAIIRGALEGFGPQPDLAQDTMATGRLLVTDSSLGCSALLDAGGSVWTLKWPDGFEVSREGVADSSGAIVAKSGALISAQGKLNRGIPGACVDGWGIKVAKSSVVDD
jgi:hypothetical protein